MKTAWAFMLSVFSCVSVAEVKVFYTPPVQASSPVKSVQTQPLKPVAKLEEVKPLPAPSELAAIEPLLGIEPVKPWQKAVLAQPAMKPAGRLPSVAKFNQKVFSSKENTRGGTGIGGGGCGCN